MPPSLRVELGAGFGGASLDRQEQACAPLAPRQQQCGDPEHPTLDLAIAALAQSPDGDACDRPPTAIAPTDSRTITILRFFRRRCMNGSAGGGTTPIVCGRTSNVQGELDYLRLGHGEKVVAYCLSDSS